MLPNRLADEIGDSEDKQSNIKLAYERIRSCLPLIGRKVKEASVMQKLDLYLWESQAAYEAGEDRIGRRYFIMFESTVFPETTREPSSPPTGTGERARERIGTR